MRSTPDPSTAIVRPARSAPRCAAESTPRASPLTTVMPRAAEVRRQPSRRFERDRRRRARADDRRRQVARAQTSVPRYQSTGGQSVSVASSGRESRVVPRQRRECLLARRGARIARACLEQRESPRREQIRVVAEAVGEVDPWEDSRRGKARRRDRVSCTASLPAHDRPKAVHPDPTVANYRQPASSIRNDAVAKNRGHRSGARSRLPQKTRDFPWYMACSDAS